MGLEKSKEKTQEEEQVKVETGKDENIENSKKAHIGKQVEIEEIKVENTRNSGKTHKKEQVKVETGEDENIENSKKTHIGKQVEIEEMKVESIRNSKVGNPGNSRETLSIEQIKLNTERDNNLENNKRTQ